MSIVIAIGVVLVAVGGAVALWRLCRLGAASDRWALIVVSAGIVAFITLGVMGEIEGLLQAMHPLGRTGRGVMAIIADPVRARATVDAWQNWFSQPYATASAVAVARPPLAPRTAASWFLGIDSFAFVPAYVLFLGVLFRRAQKVVKDEAHRRATLVKETDQGTKKQKVKQKAREDMASSTLTGFQRTAVIAAGILALVPFFDLLENGILWRFVDRRVEACPSGLCEDVNVPSDGFVQLLRVVSYTKLILVAGAIVVALLPLAAWVRLGTDWFRSLRPALRRLRGPIVVLVVFFVLMWANPQTKDVFRGWDLPRGALAFLAAVAAAYVTWSIGRRVTRVRRGKDEAGHPLQGRDPRQVRWWMFGAGVALFLVGFTGIWFDLGPRGLMIPGLFLAALGLFDPAGEDIVVAAPVEVSAPIRDQVPALLAAAWPIALSYFVARSLFPLTMYDHAGSFLYVTVVYVSWTIVVPATSIAFFYYGFLYAAARASAVRREPRPASGRPSPPGTMVGRAVSGAIMVATPTDTRRHPYEVDALIVAGVLLWWRVLVNPWAVGQGFGAIALVVAFFAVSTAAVGWVSLFVERSEPPGLFKVLRVQRTPVFLLLLLWLVLTSVLPLIGREDFHDVRTIRAGVDRSLASMGTNDLFARWIANQPGLAADGAPGVPRQAVPLILVATEGGGVKAATWTALVLDCVLSPDPIVDRCPGHDGPRLASVFAESGVSGGSVGLVEYTRYAADPALADRSGDWIEQRLGADFVSPSIAWQLYIETPRAWLQFDAGLDRAEVLERGWEQTWVEEGRFGLLDALLRGAPASEGPLAEGFRSLFANDTNVPLLLLNGFSVQDGCKFVTTPIDGNGPESDSLNCVVAHADVEVRADPSLGRPGFLSGSRVLTDLLCKPDDDVRLSTAALLSARFPYVSPSGRLLSCGEESRRAINVVDGGYGENTGAGSVLELWQSLRPLVDEYNGDPSHGACLVPVLLQIQSGYGPPADMPSTGQAELAVPPKGILRAPNGFTVWQRNAAQLAVLDPLPFTGSATQKARQGVYAHVYPYAHPGAEAPLGWTLSDEARNDLRAQLSATGNVEALGGLEVFLNDPGTCAPGDQATA
jgi:hypothetical protein